MADNKKSFILYADLIHTVRKMPADKAGELFLTILAYVNDENPAVEDIMVDLVFEPIKQQLKRDLREWEEAIQDRSTSGRIGNLKRWNKDLYDKYFTGEIALGTAEQIAKGRKAINNVTTETGATCSVANIAVNVNDTVNVNVTDTSKRVSVVPACGDATLQKEYEQLVKSVEGRDRTDIWTTVKTFLKDKRPAFLEPYMDAWNLFATSQRIIKNPQSITDKRRKKFAVRIREPGFDFLKILECIKASEFAKGNNSSGWKVTIEFILESQENYTKILEGKYE